MSRTTIDIFIRSLKTVELEPDIFEYSYKKVSGIPATVDSQTFMQSYNESSNRSVTLSSVLRFIFANDKENRIGRITYVKYGGSIYTVNNIENYPPRVKITLGDVFGTDEEEIKGVVTDE